MNRSRGTLIVLKLALLPFAVIGFSCTPPNQPPTTPPTPQFVPSNPATNPVDQGIFADVGAQNAIVIQWQPDSTVSTSGYVLYRSVNDSTVGSDGLLVNRTTAATLESNNFPLTTPPTFFEDTTGIVPGATYYYQLQGFNRASNNSVTYGQPTHPGLATSFHYASRVILLGPIGLDSLHGFPLRLYWQDPNNGGTYQVIVQRLDDQEYVCSKVYPDDANPAVMTYPSNATPLLANVEYQWRVKWVEPHGGSSSSWSAFTIVP